MKHKIWIRRKDKIRQRYWKNYSSIPLEKAKYITLYHGTSKRNIPNIMKEGLQPSAELFSSRIPYISLTPNIHVAVRHAIIGPEKEFTQRQFATERWLEKPSAQFYEKDPAVLKVTLPIEKIEDNKIVPPIREDYEYRVHQTIEPKFIKPVSFKKLTLKAIRRHPREHEFFRKIINSV